MTKSTRIEALAVLLFAACNAGPTDDQTGDDTQAGAFVVNAAIGLSKIEHPFADEKLLDGQILVEQNNAPVNDVTVTVNGSAALPRFEVMPGAPADGLFDVSKVDVPGIATATSVEVVAKRGAETTSLSAPCPPDSLKITAPAEGAQVTAGSEITISWSGNVFLDAQGLSRPTASIRGYDAAANRMDRTISELAEITSGASSTTVVVPEPEDPFNGWVVELSIPGALVTQGSSGVRCNLLRRVHLKQ